MIMRYAREIEERLLAADKLLSEAQSFADDHTPTQRPIVRIRDNLLALASRLRKMQEA